MKYHTTQEDFCPILNVATKTFKALSNIKFQTRVNFSRFNKKIESSGNPYITRFKDDTNKYQASIEQQLKQNNKTNPFYSY